MHHEVIFPNSRAIRRLRKTIPAVDGKGFSTIPDGEEEVFFCTAINMESLKYMAICAAANKSQVSKSGPLTVTVISRRKLI